MPKISVLIPSFNHALFIGEAIQSVLNQTFQDIEILIIDDGSKDNSIEIIEKFTDSRIYFAVNEENKGAVYTTNKMIELSAGEYIALLNSDDVWETDKLAKQIEFMEKNRQYAAVFSNAEIINQDGSLFHKQEHLYTTIFEQSNRSRFEWLNYFFNVGNALCHPSMLIRKSVYNEVGLYNPLMASLPDFEMWVRVCLKYEIYVMPEKLIKFRILDNEQNASGANPANIIACQFEHKHILDHFSNLSIQEYEKIFNNPVINSVEFSLALQALKKQSQFFKMWGLDTLYAILEKNPTFLLPKEFTNLTRSNDVFNIFNKTDYFIQLYIDQGSGFSEDNSIKFPVSPNTEVQEFTFSFSDQSAIKALRLDPLNYSCVIEIERLYGKTENGEINLLPLLQTNAIVNHEKNYFFTAEDSQIFFDKLNKKILLQALIVNIRYTHIGNDALHVIEKQINQEIITIKSNICFRFLKKIGLF